MPSIYFFAVDFAKYPLPVTEPAGLANQIVAKALQKGTLDPKASSVFRDRVEESARGLWPEPPDSVSIGIYLWLLESLAEPITLPYQDVRSDSDLEEASFWDYFQEHVSASAPNCEGMRYLDSTQAANLQKHVKSAGLSERRELRVLQEELLEIVESVASDGLALLAVRTE
ncbi:hypothetical protein [Blastopirellula retiformator]|uniref:Uncharacterized protein n=1 Tax=Blastopirellula retiformator TaxID=2527970 RepID=A0A5C5V286_9BACT|nr:hypothetical protein [Blastopirellula retiformator]TWT32080.1 hypothetical protein Enr8_40060 [Blastopirellula retiformator]